MGRPLISFTEADLRATIAARAVPALRRAERPPCPELCAEIEAIGYEAVGRRYGVTGNAIRKWRRAYEAEQADGDQLVAGSRMPSQ